MKLLENEELQRMVDYSFGDQSGVLGDVPNAYMKKANLTNEEFVKRVWNFQSKQMTLFIDNIRLYRRPIEYSDWLHMKPVSNQDRGWLNQFEDEDLLELCKRFPTTKFIVFTAFEDTPLDKYIQVPDNVTIYSANGVVMKDRVYPFPHGIERKMYEGYDHHEVLLEMIDLPIQPEPKKALFVAHRSDTGDRAFLGATFKDKEWATVTHLPYREYLTEMKRHKFVLCPSGNGIESARNWETLYMRRVPIFKRHPYLEEMFKDFPVLFVDDFSEVTEDLLKKKTYLFWYMQTMDMNKLDLDYWFKKCLGDETGIHTTLKMSPTKVDVGSTPALSTNI